MEPDELPDAEAMDGHRQEVDFSDAQSSSSDEGGRLINEGGTDTRSSHSYLGEVDDISCRSIFLEEGAVLTLPLFYLEGIVLFPGATLPLRLLEPRDKAAVELAKHHEEAPCTLGVVHTRARTPYENVLQCALVGTTAEIRQLRSVADGSIIIVARGCQRFRTGHVWTNADGVVCAEVCILSEDLALHIPRDAFGKLASVLNYQSGKDPLSISELKNCQSKLLKKSNEEGCEVILLESSLKQKESEPQTSGDKWSSRDFARESQLQSLCQNSGSRQEERDQRAVHNARQGRGDRGIYKSSACGKDEKLSISTDREGMRLKCFRKRWALDASKCLSQAQCSAWPHWVYRMYDAFDLARHAADLWQQIVELPSIYDMVRWPEMLAYHIASRMPVQDATRQELLELDGVVSRLQREIQLLESMNCLKCKCCMALIARQSDILLMSAEGPLDAFVNNYGIVHETLTLLQTQGLTLAGGAETQHSWFPGYSWTMAFCNSCKSHMGWLYKAVKKGMHPRLFWGVRRSQLAESTHQNPPSHFTGE